MASPPKTVKSGTGNIPDYSRKERGVDRRCDTCGEERSVNRQNYAVKKAGLRGWSTTCRQCQGREAGQRRLDGSGKIATEAKQAKQSEKAEKARIRNLIKLPSPKPLSGFIHAIDQLVDEMYELSGLGKLTAAQRKRLDQIIDALSAAVRLPGDPAGYGMAIDEDTAFRTFLRVTRPSVLSFAEMGAVHEPVIEGLVSPEPRVLILASRGTGKSLITAQFVCWKLFRNHLEMALCVSKSDNQAKALLKGIKSFIISCPMLECLKPDEKGLDSATQFEVKAAIGKLGMFTSVFSCGLTGQLTGKRASILIADDVETPRNSATVELVDTLQEQVGEFQHIMVPGAKLIYLGTPQSVFSLYGRLARNPEFKVFRAQIFAQDDIDGKTEIDSLWPARFSADQLMKTKRSISKIAWRLHYAIDLDETIQHERPLQLKELPVLDWPADATHLPVAISITDKKLDGFPTGSADLQADWWLEAIPSSEHVAPISITTLAVDPAGGLKGKGDAVGTAVISITSGGRGILRHLEGVRADTTQAAIARVAAIGHEFSVNHVVVEETSASLFGHQLSTVMASRGYPAIPESVSGSNQKKGSRIISTLGPVMGTGRLIILKSVLESEGGREFVNQMTAASWDGRIGIRNDDIVDAVSWAVHSVASALQVDEADSLGTSYVDYDHLLTLDLRRGGISEEEYEAYTAVDEAYERKKARLDHLLGVRREELTRGYDDPRLMSLIETLNADLHQYRQRNLTSPLSRIAPSPYNGPAV
jgi:hypothetical protein